MPHPNREHHDRPRPDTGQASLPPMPGLNAPYPAEVVYRRLWAAQFLTQAEAVGALPAYGSREWGALAPNDPRKLAAAIRAAEAFAWEGDHLAELTLAEVYHQRAVADADRAEALRGIGTETIRMIEVREYRERQKHHQDQEGAA